MAHYTKVRCLTCEIKCTIMDGDKNPVCPDCGNNPLVNAEDAAAQAEADLKQAQANAKRAATLAAKKKAADEKAAQAKSDAETEVSK